MSMLIPSDAQFGGDRMPKDKTSQIVRFQRLPCLTIASRPPWFWKAERSVAWGIPGLRLARGLPSIFG